MGGEANRAATIESVEGLDRPVRLDVITRGDILDVCVNGARTLVHRATAGTGDRLFLWCRGCGAEANEVDIRRLLP